MRKVLAVIAVALPLVSYAQSRGDGSASAQQPQPKVEYEKKTVINFEDDTIEGDLKRPDGEYVEARRKVDVLLVTIRQLQRERAQRDAGVGLTSQESQNEDEKEPKTVRRAGSSHDRILTFCIEAGKERCSFL